MADVHLHRALLGWTVIFDFYRLAADIAANLTVINDVIAEVKRIRAERGLA